MAKVGGSTDPQPSHPAERSRPAQPGRDPGVPPTGIARAHAGEGRRLRCDRLAPDSWDRRRLDPRVHYRWHRTSEDRKSTRLNSSHLVISYAVFCLKKKTNKTRE